MATVAGHPHDPVGLVLRSGGAPARAGADLPQHLAVRRAHGRGARAGLVRHHAVRATCRSSSSVTATSRCAASSTSAATAATCSAREQAGARRCSARTTRGRTTSTARCAPRHGPSREPGFDRDGLGLVPVAGRHLGAVRVRQPRPEAAPLAEHLGDLPRLVAEGGVDVDALEFHQRAEAEYDANWKVCVENYLECYHCAVAHPSFSKAIDVAPGRIPARGASDVLEPVRPAEERRRRGLRRRRRGRPRPVPPPLSRARRST